MTLTEKLIKRLFPNKIITHRLADLTDLLSNQHTIDMNICASIEKDNNTRQFCYLNIDELILLYQHSTPMQRSLYELMTPGNLVKTYVDFEYYVNNNLDIENHHIGANCILKILYYLLNFGQNIVQEKNNYIDFILKQFLILEASTSEKISYHLIHANPSILFENNITHGLFVKVVIHLSLWMILQHKCASFNINFNEQKCTILDLVHVLTPYVNTLRTCCTQCQLYSGLITVAEAAHLLVLNKQNRLTSAIDLSVYSKNQQFRLFDCVKIGKTNLLRPSIYFPFNNNNCEISYFELLRKSLVTLIESNDIPVIYLENNQFRRTYISKMNSLSTLSDNLINLNKLNTHMSTNFSSHSNTTPISSIDKLKISPQTLSLMTVDPAQNHIQQFTLFVNKLIGLDKLHQGHIHSCIRGNRNTDILFFNIVGEYRYCPRKGAHHQRNTVAILIDTKNLTYTIRCKDSDCNNKSLMWKKIE